MQLYVDKKREKSEALIRKIEDLGRLKGIFVTVDAAAPGKREADERGKAEIEVVSDVGLNSLRDHLSRGFSAADLGHLWRQNPIGQQGWRYRPFCGWFHRPQAELVRYRLVETEYEATNRFEGDSDRRGE